MRPRIVAASAAVAASIAGCTFLVDFETVDPVEGPDAGGDSAVVDAGGPGPDASPDTGPPAFPPPCDPTFPLPDLACNPSFPRPVCAKSTTVFASYPRDRAEDLVTCNGGASPTCVQQCPFGCVTMPSGYPDMCDDCAGRPDGTYCVKDLRGADTRTHALAVDCKDGKTASKYVCGVGKCATDCPRTERSPSCCI